MHDAEHWFITPPNYNNVCRVTLRKITIIVLETKKKTPKYSWVPNTPVVVSRMPTVTHLKHNDINKQYVIFH